MEVTAISVRVSAYIDGANLFYAGDSIGIRIDYAKLKSLIASGRKIVDLKFYDATENTPAENHFFARIQTFGYTLKLVKLRRYGSLTPEEKKTNTQIVADSLVEGLVRNAFDVGVFGTGDKDILPSIEYLLQAGKQVEIMSFDHTLAWDLKKSGAKIISLTRLANKIRRT